LDLVRGAVLAPFFDRGKKKARKQDCSITSPANQPTLNLHPQPDQKSPTNCRTCRLQTPATNQSIKSINQSPSTCLVSITFEERALNVYKTACACQPHSIQSAVVHSFTLQQRSKIFRKVPTALTANGAVAPKRAAARSRQAATAKTQSKGDQ
jgi:hypothetical protein